MEQQKLIVLGSDYGTLQVVKEAHKLGLFVIVADLMPTSPTKEAADEAWLISTTDIDELEKRCRAAQVEAVMFGASDFNINNARKLCRRLNLPIYCHNDRAWQIARDKLEFKKLCRFVGAPVAPDYSLSDALFPDELAKINYPVVVKPADMSGNRGMSYCDDSESLIQAYGLARSLSSKPILVEKRLRGTEYNVHYALADGEAALLYFNATHHQPGQRENLYSFKCTTSRHLKQYIEEVNESVVKLIHEAGCREGIAWVDCMRDEDGRFYLLEMGYRFGGVMTYVPYEKVCGFNTIRWMLECSLGVQHTKADLPKPLTGAYLGCAASYHLFTTCDGEVDRIIGLEELERMPNVFIDMPKRAGNLVRKQACMGLIGIYGSDIDELCKILETINTSLRVEDKNGNSMIIYFDDYETLRCEYESGLREFHLL